MRILLSALTLMLFLTPITRAQTETVELPPASAGPGWGPSVPSGGGHFTGSAEYLHWWLRPSPGPAPLVTVGSTSDSLPGALQQSGTRVLIGGQSLGGDSQPGARFTAGYQLDDNASLGVELGYLHLGRQTTKQEVSTSGAVGSPNLAVPFFDVTGVAGRNNVPGSSVYILNGPFPGSYFGLTTSSIPGVQAVYRLALARQLQGAEVNGTAWLAGQDNWRLDGLAGVRWVRLGEDLSLFGTGYGIPGAVFTGPLTTFSDQFKTENDFYGGQVGVRATYTAGRFSLGTTCKLAVGTTHEQATVAGAITTPSGTVLLSTSGTSGLIAPGGVFTQANNLGSHDRNVFAVAPELKLDVSYEVTSRMRVFLGYTFLCVSSVASPGSQVDPNINLTRTNLADLSRATKGIGSSPISFPTPQASPAASGPNAPLFNFHDSTFWAQGLNLGLGFTY